MKHYIQSEENANAITHGFGIVLGTAAGVWLLQKALNNCDLWAIGSVSIYIACMLFSYISSTVYHACRDGERKAALRRIDHIAIYFHIAGTYTFFTLTILRNEAFWGWLLFLASWTIAFTGSYISFKGKGIGKRVETFCYVAMGLVICVAFKPLIDTLSSMNALDVFWCIVAGGVAYIMGAILYTFKKIPYIHSVFHIFVMAGSFFHIMAIANALGV